MLALAGGIGTAAVAAACRADDVDVAVTTVGEALCAAVPQETAGPYPGDGTNGPNVLAESDVVRADIRASIGSASGVADGIPLTIRFRLADAADGCSPLPGAAVYAWHCTKDGNYSMYSAGFEGENFLRGVQVADQNGVVQFTSIYPGCYSGRWPHIHFEVYPDAAAATAQSGHIAVSQIALPKDSAEQVYATAGYEASVRNLARLSLESDNVFGDDGGVAQLGKITGDLTGMTVELAVAVDTAATPSMGGGGGFSGGQPTPSGGGLGDGQPPGPPPNGSGAPPPNP